MRLSGFLELPRLAKESPSPTWQAPGGRGVGFSGLSSSISFTIGTSPMGSATCVEQRGRQPQVAREQRQLSPGGATQRHKRWCNRLSHLSYSYPSNGSEAAQGSTWEVELTLGRSVG